MEKENATVEEQPTLGTTKPEQTEITLEEKATNLLEQLNSLQMDSPEKIQSVHQASQQAGTLANHLGDARERIRQLEAQVAATQQMPPQAEPEYGYQSEAVDLRKVVGEVFETKINNFVTAQQNVQRAAMEEHSTIQADPEYSVVQGIWEKHITNPNVQLAIQSGRTTPTTEFNKVKIAFYKGVAMNARDTVEGFLSKAGASAQAPHMETSDTSSHPAPKPDEAKEALQKIREQTTGTDGDIDKMLNVLLPPPGDPFYAK